MAKIYVASSWRNQYFLDVVKKLREYGHEVYDFRNPPHNHGAFMWKDVDPDFDKWTVEEYKLFDLVSGNLEEVNEYLDRMH